MAEEEKPKLKVFLCHAFDDKPKVHELYKRLVAEGIDVWLDDVNLLPGQERNVEVPKAVGRSDIVLICITNNSVNTAGNLHKEIRVALDVAQEQPEGAIFIIPVKLEECNSPDSLQRYQWANLFWNGKTFDEDGYQKLLKSLRVRAEKIGAKLIPLVQQEQLKRLTQPKSEPAQETVKKTIPLIEASTPLIEQSKSRQKINPTPKAAKVAIIIIIIGILFGLVYFGLSQSSALFPLLSVTTTITSTLPDTPTITSTRSPTSTPTLTFTPLPTPTPTITPTPTPLPERTVDVNGIAMALIPAGEFTMGNDQGLSFEKPEHRIFLSAYYIDLYEVTNASYAVCVAVGACQKPVSERSRTISNYYSDPDLANFPVVYVNWEMAQAYCAWRAGRLPTEAEWEKAARGTDQRLFPTGAGVSCTLANYCKDDTTEVGRYREPPGPFGLFDMAGNVAEWIADWYSAGYYNASLTENPTGPATGQLRVVRGGSFASSAHTELQATSRIAQKPDTALDYLGFRCVREP